MADSSRSNCSPRLTVFRVATSGVEPSAYSPSCILTGQCVSRVILADSDAASLLSVVRLDAALDNYLEEGLEAVWARHARATRIFRAGLYAMGLKIWPKSETIASDGVTAVALPEGVSPALLSEAARRLYGVNFSASQGATADKIILVALLGRVAQPMYAVTALAALGGSLNALGNRADTGAGVNAALGMINAAA